MPDVSEVLPKRSIFIRKGAESGEKISDTIRDALTKTLRQSLNQFTPITGEATYIRRRGVKAGTINDKLINNFEKDIRNVFNGYVKKNKFLRMPPNIHAIAVTEYRGSIADIRSNYTDQLLQKNKNLETFIYN